MKKIFINNATQTIELSESFAKKAGNLNSPEYNDLKEVKTTHPTYKVKVLKSTHTKKSTAKGITIELMRKYVEKHNSDNFLNEFDSLVEEKTSYFEIKAKVLNHYPQCKNYKTKADWILAA
jgi:hypothetical protein